MIRKINIPPVWFILSVITIITFYFSFRESPAITFPINLIGLFFVIFGFGIIGKARELFRKHQTPHNFENPVNLLDEGVFSRTRNPMYLGMFLVLFGIAICFKLFIGLLIPFIFIAFVQVFFIPKEEKTMGQIFGQEYVNYKKSVGRWLTL
jgi:protein-S-isoprenylcysteine O-methyltransferase Ste14